MFCGSIPVPVTDLLFSAGDVSHLPPLVGYLCTVYIYIHIYTCIYIYINLYTSIYIYVQLLYARNAHVNVNVNVNNHPQIQVLTHTQKYTYFFFFNIYIYILCIQFIHLSAYTRIFHRKIPRFGPASHLSQGPGALLAAKAVTVEIGSGKMHRKP